MRIKHFMKIIYDEAVDYKLQNSEVVIDGQNFFYQLYKVSSLQSKFGCESDKYAEYLRSYLSNFKKANVKCYFFFKGGHEDPSRMCKKSNENKSRLEMGKTPVTLDKQLIFTKDIYKEVLEEMGFEYVTCQFEAKRECIAFAQKRNCPIISNDIEFCFSGVSYIPINFNTGLLDIDQCKLFILDDFMRKFRINEEKLAIFVVLTDEYKFPENHFQEFMAAMRITRFSNYVKNKAILKWLSGTANSQAALRLIFKYAPSDRTTFLEKHKEVTAFIRRQEKQGLPSQFLENQCALQFMEKDPQWFEKGVVTQAVAIPYINLYRWNTIIGSWETKDNDAPDALLLSLDIIKYAFGLLWNFRKKEFIFAQETLAGDINKIIVKIPSNFQNCTAVESPFENGWSQVRALGLFEHFLTETLPVFDFSILNRLPEDARLLFIALVYFSHKKPEVTRNEVCSVLLSYLALNILSGLERKNPVDTGLASRPILLDTMEKDSVVYEDKLVARRNLAEYLDELPEGEEANIYNVQSIHSVVEFQHCLEHFNYLNRLCGRPYQPTLYSKTFNGTLVHRVLFSLNRQTVCPFTFCENKLMQASTVLAFWKRLTGVINILINHEM